MSPMCVYSQIVSIPRAKARYSRVNGCAGALTLEVSLCLEFVTTMFVSTLVVCQDCKTCQNVDVCKECTVPTSVSLSLVVIKFVLKMYQDWIMQCFCLFIVVLRPSTIYGYVGTGVGQKMYTYNTALSPSKLVITLNVLGFHNALYCCTMFVNPAMQFRTLKYAKI